MTTKTDTITPPPLPHEDFVDPGRFGVAYSANTMIAYARAAVGADRQGRMPSDAELKAWGQEEEFFLFCDPDEFLDIVKSALARYGSSQPAASAEPPKLTDDEIERLVIQLGVTWKEDAWKIEDADLHPMVRALLYRYTAAPVAQEPVGDARLDTVLKGSPFWRPLLPRRIIVPADGWYEWTGDKGDRQPWYINPKDGAPILMAGMTAWQPGRHPRAGRPRVRRPGRASGAVQCQGSPQRFIGPLASQPRYSGAVSVPSQRSRSIVKLAEHDGKQTDGIGGCLASAGSGGISAGGTETGDLPAQALRSSAGTISISSRSSGLCLGIINHSFPRGPAGLFRLSGQCLSISNLLRLIALNTGHISIPAPALHDPACCDAQHQDDGVATPPG